MKHKKHETILESPTPEEEKLLTSLRASSWNEFRGQEKIKEALKIAITATKKRKEPLEHILLYGPPGLCKTTMAHLIGRELGVNVRVTSGPAIERAGDLASILTNLEPHDILFIDEIHRLNKVVEETIYPAMEDFALDIVIAKVRQRALCGSICRRLLSWVPRPASGFCPIRCATALDWFRDSHSTNPRSWK